jgi:hypothetical protein
MMPLAAHGAAKRSPKSNWQFMETRVPVEFINLTDHTIQFTVDRGHCQKMTIPPGQFS